jgi:hypothetical protein
MMKSEACRYFRLTAYKLKAAKLPLPEGNRKRGQKTRPVSQAFFPFVLSSTAVLLNTVETLLTTADPHSYANTSRCLTVLPQTLNRGFEPVNNFAASEAVIFSVFCPAAHKKDEKRGKKASLSLYLPLIFIFSSVKIHKKALFRGKKGIKKSCFRTK